MVHEPPTAANSSLLEATKSFNFLISRRMKVKIEDHVLTPKQVHISGNVFNLSIQSIIYVFLEMTMVTVEIDLGEMNQSLCFLEVH